MKYVNPELFINFEDIKNNPTVNGGFAWLLLAGNKTTIKTETETDKKLNIYRRAVVGFAVANRDNLVLNKESAGTIKLTIPGSPIGHILYIVGSNSGDKGLDAAALALVKTKCAFTTEVASDNIEEFREEGYCGYEPPTSSEQMGTYVPEYIKTAEEDEYLKDVIVIAAYDVSSSDVINNYNYSGFTVSDSAVEISGLYQD